jgi:methyl-accepting chemotaxis protein
MRVRLSSQGLTGLMYLEVDYMDPELAEPLEINWKPEVPYLPSAPGRITLIADSLEKVAVGLERSNIEGIANNINELIVTIRGTVEELQLNDLTNRATELVNEVRQTNQEINDLLTSQEVKQMASDAASTVAAARGMVDGSENDIRNTVGQLRQTVERLNEVTAKAKDLLNSPEIQTGLQNFASTSENARNASENLPETLESVQRSLKRVDLMLGSRQQDLQAIIQNLRQVSENLREITDDARKYPSYTLFGNPPEPRETEK